MKGGDIPVAGSSCIIGFHDESKSNGPINITIGRSGSVGKTNIYYGPIWPHNTSLYVDDFKGNDEHYIFYLLKLINLEFLATSSVVPSLDRKTVYPMEVPFIEGKNKQQKLVSVLRVIDRKISLNHKANEVLEKMAKQIYDYWFVQFDFPDENGKPYKSSGGKMVYNETLKREIPDGWEVKKLSEIGNFKNGINYDKDEQGDKDYLIVNVRNISSSSLMIDSGDLDKLCLKQCKADAYLIKEGDILIARSGNPGATRYFFETSIDTLYCGFIICLSPIDIINTNYLLLFMKDREEQIKKLIGGSIMPNISQESLKPIHIVMPSAKTIKSFNLQVASIFEKLKSNSRESLRLTSLRDFLLPMLMNGQVTIKNND